MQASVSHGHCQCGTPRAGVCHAVAAWQCMPCSHCAREIACMVCAWQFSVIQSDYHAGPRGWGRHGVPQCVCSAAVPWTRRRAAADLKPLKQVFEHKSRVLVVSTAHSDWHCGGTHTVWHCRRACCSATHHHTYCTGSTYILCTWTSRPLTLTGTHHGAVGIGGPGTGTGTATGPGCALAVAACKPCKAPGPGTAPGTDTGTGAVFTMALPVGACARGSHAAVTVAPGWGAIIAASGARPSWLPVPVPAPVLAPAAIGAPVPGAAAAAASPPPLPPPYGPGSNAAPSTRSCPAHPVPCMPLARTPLAAWGNCPPVTAPPVV